MTQGFTFWRGQGRATYGDDLSTAGDRIVPSEIFVEIQGGLSQPDLSMKIEVRQGVPVCTEVCLRSRPDGPEVREKDLAQIRLSWLDQIVAQASMKFTGVPGQWGSGWGKPVDDKSALADIRRIRSGRSRSVSQERLSKVAEIYREHVNDRPTQAVSRAFDVSHRTAARYVQQSRELGLLPPTVPGKKKA